MKDEQIKGFWEWCGLQVRVVNYENDSWVEWLDPKDIFISRVAPPIDLNNLFLYAVPKYIRHYEDKGLHTAEAWSRLFSEWLHYMVEKVGNDPALALFKVLDEVRVEV